ncbi:hypothetical protein [Tsukamurella sp. NPDC003166]|uniref:hypothetical protein n=1 Tax=Tsukamurella sp. NPDC003166 TaxID=3154444 RepID=UPI0033A89A12
MTDTTARPSIPADLFGDAEIERRCIDALRREIEKLPEGTRVRWATLRRALPENSPNGCERESALLHAVDDGLAVLEQRRGTCWIERADAYDRATAALPRSLGERWPRNACAHD